jgi:secreted Zn-dependent insulinase-like peptidase
MHSRTPLLVATLSICPPSHQSAERPAHYLDARIEAWIESVGADLQALTAAEFDDYRAAVVAEKLERDKTLSEECSRHWRRIADGSLDFERGMVICR